MTFTDTIWVSLPLAVRRLSAGLAVAMVDGLYLAVRPVIGWAAPAAALFVGLMVGAFHPGFDIVFTEALWLLILVAVVGTLSGALGLYLTLGFTIGDLLLGDHPVWRFAELGDMPAMYGSLLISYLLFAMLAVGVPIAAKSLAAELMLPVTTPRPLRAVAGLGAMVVINGLLVFVWLQAAPLLVRPVFRWADQLPTVEAISAVQAQGTWVVAVAVLAAMARAVLQFAAAAKVGDRMADLEAQFLNARPVVPIAARLPLVVRLVFRAALLTFILSGLFGTIWQAQLTFIALVAAQLVATMLSARRLTWYTRLVNKVPRLVRILIVAIPVYLLGTVVLSFYISKGEQSFLPFLFLTIISAILMTLLSPVRPEEQRR